LQHYVGLFGDIVMICFIIKPSIPHLCRLFSGGRYWMQFWARLQHEDTTNELFRWRSSSLEVIVALEIVNLGWKHSNSLFSYQYTLVCFVPTLSSCLAIVMYSGFKLLSLLAFALCLTILFIYNINSNM
jgi:hypothetical protein